MYKKLLALCLAALLTASAAGCSQGTEGSSAPAEGGSAPAGDAAPSGEVVTIRMGGWGNFEDEHAPGTVGMEEAIGVKIEFQKYPTDADFWNNLPAQIAAKTAPDFISLTNELYLPYINDGLVVPLTSYVEDGTISCWDSIAQNLKDIWEIDGEIYGIPTHQSPAVFAINMNQWNEAGLTEDDFPETWDDVLAICQVFKDQLGMTGLPSTPSPSAAAGAWARPSTPPRTPRPCSSLSTPTTRAMWLPRRSWAWAMTAPCS